MKSVLPPRAAGCVGSLMRAGHRLAPLLLLVALPWAHGAQSNPGGGSSPPPAPPPAQPPPQPPTPQPFIPWRTPPQLPADPNAVSDFVRDQQLRDWRRAHPMRMFFPPNPPPLGVEAVLPADTYVRGAPPPAVVADVAEPYFPPLSTRVIEPQLGLSRSSRHRLEEYRSRRDDLLAALRNTLAEQAGNDAATRFAALETLAGDQADALNRLEKQAEKLRAELADGASWFEHRNWRLGTGDLDRPREQNRFLEYQVLRAAAFYEPGLEPEQRRLLREAAQALEEKVFSARDAVDAMALYPFFSPDLLRVHLPAVAPPSAVAAMERFQAQKVALRDEARETAYTHDADTEAARRRMWQRLARDQAPALATLDEIADEVRRELAAMPDQSWRAIAPSPLTPAITAEVDRYLAARRDLQQNFEDYAINYVAGLDAEDAGTPVMLPEKKAETRRQQIQAATAKFITEQVDTLQALAGSAASIAAALQSGLPARERMQSGDDAEEWLMEFLQHRRQAEATREFEVAAFEPGLSPPQRRLLFRAACARLGLPLVGPERQPVEAPKTLLR